MDTPVRVKKGAGVLRVGRGSGGYPVVLDPGGLKGLGSALASRCAPGPCVMVTNPVVGALYADAARASLEGAGFTLSLLEVPDGERHKDIDTWADLVDALLGAGVDRRTPILALGGGVTGDLVGFAAATVLRGVPFVQVPTTLLAMVDSSVGGKTGVNSPRGKNLVGVFYPPKLVYAAMSVLDTLPEAEWRCGLGEAVKTALVGDAEFVGWMEAHAAEIRARAPGICLALVSRCCAIKAAVVSKDEREEGLRAILNFGHTVGHAIETAMGHGTMRHGEAVALGLLAEARHAEARGWVEEPGYCARLALLLAALGLPRGLEEVEGARGLGSTDGSSLETRLLDAARLDKKRARGSISLVVPLRVGRVRLEKVPAENLAELLTFVPPAMEPT